MKKTKYVATFTSGLLATKPADSEIFARFIAAKEREAAKDELDAEEMTLARLDDLEKGTTVFHRDADGRPIIWDYQIKGFLKDAWRMLAKDKDSHCAKVKAYIKMIDGGVFVTPRMIPLELPEGAKIGLCQRPLRAQTAQGERVALASSEEAPEGTKIRFTVTQVLPGLEKGLEECFEYAQFRFMGAWRNSGKGTAIIEKVDGKDEEEKE